MACMCCISAWKYHIIDDWYSYVNGFVWVHAFVRAQTAFSIRMPFLNECKFLINGLILSELFVFILLWLYSVDGAYSFRWPIAFLPLYNMYMYRCMVIKSMHLVFCFWNFFPCCFENAFCTALEELFKAIKFGFLLVILWWLMSDRLTTPEFESPVYVECECDD